MKLLHSGRAAIHHYFLQKKLKQQHVEHHTCGYKQASRIGLLFDITSPQNVEPVKKYHQYLRGMNKSVHPLAYIEKERPTEAIPFDYFTKKELNWFLMPSHPKVSDFINDPFDLLINLSTEQCLPVEYISALSKAKFRVGRYIPNKPYCYDLMIDMQDLSDINFLIEQVEHYLRMIK